MLKFFLRSCAVLLLSISLLSNGWAGIDFDGTDDQVDLTTMAINTLSIVISFKVDDLDSTQWLFYRQAKTGSSQKICLIVTTSGAVQLNLATSDTGTIKGYPYFASNAGIISPGVLYHFIVTWQAGATSANMYLNGNGITCNYTANSHSAGYNIVYELTTSHFKIGYADYYSESLAGEVTELAVYNIVLSAAEAEILGKSKIKYMPLQIKPSNLWAYYSLDYQTAGTSADGDMVTDLSGNGNNGTGDNGANNTGLTWTEEYLFSYPMPILGN